MAPYRYTPLNSTEPQIRLLTLHSAGHEADTLTGSISQRRLDDNLVYEALSYTWCHDGLTSSVRLNNFDFNIGRNLELALRHIRYRDEDRIVWIDAICIDQSNEDERTEQVQLMRQIFTSSKRVIAWLGETSVDSDLALEVLEKLGEKDIVQMAAASFICPRWTALKRLWRRPFWRRIWIVQELALGNGRVVIQCGHTVIARKALEQAFKALQSHLDNPLTLLWEALDCDMDWFMNMLAVCCGYDHARTVPNGDQHLEALLDFTGHFLATDDRDHIYALLGLSQDGPRAGIEPDYSKTLEQVCAHTVRQLVKSKHTMMVLYGNRSVLPSNLSSWMPTFGDRVRRGYGWRRGFQASGYSTDPSIEISDCGRLLEAKGVFVDYIDAVEGPFENTKVVFQDPSVLNGLKAMATRACAQADQEGLRDGTESVSTSLLKTLMANAGELNNRSGLKHSLHTLEPLLEGLLRPVDPTQNCQQRIEEFAPLIRGMVITLRYRCFFTTKRGYIGVGPYNMKSGDFCAVLYGGEVPFVLRKQGKQGGQGQGQILIGDCYVHGIMDGELIQSNERHCRERTFVVH